MFREKKKNCPKPTLQERSREGRELDILEVPHWSKIAD